MSEREVIKLGGVMGDTGFSKRESGAQHYSDSPASAVFPYHPNQNCLVKLVICIRGCIRATTERPYLSAGHEAAHWSTCTLIKSCKVTVDTWKTLLYEVDDSWSRRSRLFLFTPRLDGWLHTRLLKIQITADHLTDDALSKGDTEWYNSVHLFDRSWR